MSCAAVSCAEERKETPKPGAAGKVEAAKGDKKRLESVTWDLKSHKLIWTVQTGEAGSNGEFVAKTTERYEIIPDKALMAVREEKRGFTEQEAASLHKLLDTLSLYCVESVVWWERGEGDPLDANGKPLHKRQDSPPNPHRRPRPDGSSSRTLIGLNLPD
jgi:hypothetical protein